MTAFHSLVAVTIVGVIAIVWMIAYGLHQKSLEPEFVPMPAAEFEAMLQDMSDLHQRLSAIE